MIAIEDISDWSEMETETETRMIEEPSAPKEFEPRRQNVLPETSEERFKKF